METKRGGVESAVLERVRLALEGWRARRRHGERIPDDIWRMAAAASKRYGTTRVCRALRLGYSELKRRTADFERVVPLEQRPTFKELSFGPALPGAGCVVELEKPNGVRLRVSVPVHAGVDWSQLKAAFLEA